MFNNSISGYNGGSQSLSGVYTFSDGMGTIIENGTVTTNDAYVNDANIVKDNQLTTKLYVDSVSGINLLPRNNIWSGTNAYSVIPTITATMPSNTDATTKIPTTAWTQSTINNKLTPLPTLAGNNTFTNTNLFNTSSLNVSPLQIVYTGSIPNNNIQFAPKVSASTFNPYCLDGDSFIGADVTTAVVFGKRDKYNAIRITDTDIDYYASDNMKFTINDLLSGSFDINGNFTINYAFNSVYSSTTVYENQFVGDIWTQKGLTCKNGLFIQNDIIPGSTTYAAINNAGQAQLASLSTPTGNITTLTTTNLTTTTPINSDNSTKCATTAYVKNQGYASTSTTNTFSQQQTFTNGFISNSTMYNQGLAGTTLWQFTDISNATLGTIKLNNNNFYIYSGGVSGVQTFQVKDSGGTIQNVLQLGYASPTLNTSSPLIQTATMPATSDNSNKTPTTSWVQSVLTNYATNSTLSNYALNSSLNNYALLNASQQFTGQQTFYNASINFALRVNSSTAVSTREGAHFVTTSSGSFNPIVTANDYVIMGRDTATLGAGALCLTTHSSTNAGIRITDSQNLMYGTTQTNGNLKINNTVEGPTTSYATTSSHIGYVNHITSFTAPSGNAVNILGTYVFDNASNYSYGTYLVITNIRCTPVTAGVQVKLSWSTQTTVMTGLWVDSQTTLAPNILKITAPIQVYSTQTWYLLFQVVTGAYTFNSSTCSLDIVRIA